MLSNYGEAKRFITRVGRFVISGGMRATTGTAPLTQPVFGILSCISPEIITSNVKCCPLFYLKKLFSSNNGAIGVCGVVDVKTKQMVVGGLVPGMRQSKFVPLARFNRKYHLAARRASEASVER